MVYTPQDARVSPAECKEGGGKWSEKRSSGEAKGAEALRQAREYIESRECFRGQKGANDSSLLLSLCELGALNTS
jgi:hypothetical protein